MIHVSPVAGDGELLTDFALSLLYNKDSSLSSKVMGIPLASTSSPSPTPDPNAVWPSSYLEADFWGALQLDLTRRHWEYPHIHISFTRFARQEFTLYLGTTTFEYLKIL